MGVTMRPRNRPARLAALVLLGFGVMGMSVAHASDAANAWYQPRHGFLAQGGFDAWSPPAEAPVDPTAGSDPTPVSSPISPPPPTAPRTPQNWRLYVSEPPLETLPPAPPLEDWLSRPRTGMDLRPPL